MKNKESRQVLGRRVLAPALILALIAVMVFPAAAALVYPTVTVSPIGAHTIGDTVVVSATSTTPCYRMAAKVEYNGTTTWLTDSYTNSFYDTFVVSNTGVYTVTVYARSYEPSDPRSANSGATPISFTVYAPHTHSYGYVQYEDAHPHYAYQICTAPGICDQPKRYSGGYYAGNYSGCTYTTGYITKHWCANDEDLTQLLTPSVTQYNFCRSYTTTVTDDTVIPGYDFTHSLVTDASGTAVQSASATRTVNLTASSPYGYVRYQFEENLPELEWITLSQPGLSLDNGDTYQLVVGTYPTEAEIPSITWSSSNSAVATVSASGLVTAVGGGTAIITATPDATGISSVHCTVEVTKYGITVANHYDNAFSARYGSDSASVGIINSVMSVTRDVYQRVFGLRITELAPAKFNSLTDLCLTNQGLSIGTNLTYKCIAHAPSCTLRSKAFEDFQSKYPSSYTRSEVLWTGKVLYDADGEQYNRSFSQGNWISMEVMEQLVSGFPEAHLETYAHEIGHQVGGIDHYHDVNELTGSWNSQCGNYPYCSDCGSSDLARPAKCLMACYENLIMSSNVDYADVFCAACKNDIYAHLENHNVLGG